MTLKHQSTAQLPTRRGNFTLHVFEDAQGTEVMAVVSGTPKEDCLVRVHSECATGDILGSLRCDCRQQLETALEMIDREGCGIVIYLRGHEGRGIGLANKVKAYALQEKGMDTVEANLHLGFPADARDYAAAVEALQHFGVSTVRLLTNNQKKVEALENAGIKVSQRVPLWLASNPHNEDYLATKKKIMGHLSS